MMCSAFLRLTELARSLCRNLNRAGDGRSYPAIFQDQQARNCASSRCYNSHVVKNCSRRIERTMLTCDCILDLRWVCPWLEGHPCRTLDG
jgi:hypothetical protein